LPNRYIFTKQIYYSENAFENQAKMAVFLDILAVTKSNPGRPT
jgi:hypothetical protein